MKKIKNKINNAEAFASNRLQIETANWVSLIEFVTLKLTQFERTQGDHHPNALIEPLDLRKTEHILKRLTNGIEQRIVRG